MLHLDGSAGEGGGQILRTALALSALTGQAFRIEHIRRNREKPGLARQHLTAVQAAAACCGARVTGAEPGSRSLSFAPGRVRPGDHTFAIGTAGSTSLVLQTVLPALLLADGPSRVHVTGGTHNPKCPPFDFLQRAFAPLLRAMGFGIELTLHRAGFRPAGGGEIAAAIAPGNGPRRLDLLDRGPGLPPQVRILLSNLPDRIAVRERAVLQERLGHLEPRIAVESVPSPGPGNAITVTLPAVHATEVVTAIGERGIPAERVAAAAADEALALLAADVPVGPHLADQLLIPLALAGAGTFRTVRPTLHTTTNVHVIEVFLPVRFRLREDEARPGTWLVGLDVERT